MPYQPGDILLDTYRIEALIAEGSFGEVYRVTHLELKVERAIKVLKGGPSDVGSTAWDDARQRFKLEAQLGARLNSPTSHPNLLQVHNFHAGKDLLVLEMEYAPGGSLVERVARARKNGQPLPIDEVIQIGIDVASGLAALHARDIVHRDLKPSNILFDDKGRAKVADLGLAQIPGGASMRSQLSQAVRHPGTPAYMSLEQEEYAGYLTPSSDVYALGLLLFEMLTGRNYKSQPPGTRLRSLCLDVPRWLDNLVSCMLAEDPKKRPWNGQAVADELRRGLGRLRKKRPMLNRQALQLRLLLIVSVILLALLIFGVVWLWMPTSPSLGQTSSISPTSALVAIVTTASLSPTIAPTPTVTLAPIILSSPTRTPSLTFTPTSTRTSTPTRVSITEDNVVQIAPLRTLNWLSDVRGFTFSPDGLLVASYSGDAIQLWQFENGSLLHTLQGGEPPVAFSHDGLLLASELDDKTIRIWRVEDGTPIYTMEGHTEGTQVGCWTSSLAFSPDDTLLASSGCDNTIKLWQVSDGSLHQTLPGHEYWGGYGVQDVAFSPDGSTLASAGANTVRLWHIPDGTLLRSVLVANQLVYSVAFSPDGSMLASGSLTWSVKLVRVSDGELLDSIETNGAVREVAFSPDGSMLLTNPVGWSGDNLIKIWRASDGSLLFSFDESIRYATWLPDGTQLLTVDNDRIAEVWGVVP